MNKFCHRFTASHIAKASPREEFQNISPTLKEKEMTSLI